ncbi:MAG: Uma2 family endonuclease [Myxococcota bacterium]|nr:Uma2 family endonuclease [Myxococcota bacterium]
MRESLYDVDPTDPRAPPQELWDAMSEAERRRVLATLPSEPEWAAPPQGDEHRKLKQGALDALEQYFRRTGRRVYLASELPVYYPGERVFAPDLIAVVDVEPRDRMSWVVSAEKRGIDLVLEIHVGGERGKDLRRNVEWFARLGIPEYFVFDAPRARVFGYRLPEGGARTYEPIIPQGGSWTSIILGLDLVVAQGRLRWVHGGALLPESHELIERLTSMVDQALRRAEEEARRAEEEARRAEEEARRGATRTKAP